MATLAADAACDELVAGIVDDVNRERSRFEQIKRFAILPRDFTMEDDEVTPTLKLRRTRDPEHFADDGRRAVRRPATCRRVAAHATARARAPRRVASGRSARGGGRRRSRAYQESSRLEILTTSPVCGAWMNWPPPM